MLNAQPAQAQTTNTNRRVIARFLNSPEDPANLTLLAQYGASIHWHSLMLPGLVSINCPNQNGIALAKALSASPSVKYAENISNPGSFSSAPCTGHAGSNLPVLTPANVSSYQWARKNTGEVVANVVGTAGADANMVPAWQVTTGSPDIVVAVIDGSISIDHPALVNSLWTNENEIPGDNIDNDANGVVDDVHGAKFAEDQGGNLLILGDPRPEPNVTGDLGHGTSTAGLIFSSHTYGVKGVAPSCKLMAIGLLTGRSASFELELLPERLVMALDYALYMKARVSSVSINFPEAAPTAFLELLDVAENLDHLMVASAGNFYCNCDIGSSANSRYPVAHSLTHPAIIGAAATDNNDCLAIYWDGLPEGCRNGKGSNFGQQSILLGAPGWRNVSLRMMPDSSLGLYDWFGGTSSAAPHVAGAVALLLSIHPEYTCADIKDKLVSSGRAVDSLDGITISGKTLDIGALINP